VTHKFSNWVIKTYGKDLHGEWQFLEGTGANGKKFKIHNTAESLDRPIVTDDDDGGQTLADFIIDHTPSPLDAIINQSEYFDNVNALHDKMTSMEKTVFESYTKENTYQAIGEELHIKPKAADNALMRIRKKATKIYQDYDANEAAPAVKKAKRKTRTK